MRLLQLVKEHQGVGPPSDGFRQLAPFLVAHIARGRSDEPGDGMLFHIFRHIQPEHCLLAAVYLCGQGSAQLCFSHPGGAGEEQAGNGPPRVPDAAGAPAHRLRHGADSTGLAHHMAGQQAFQVQHPLPFHRRQPSHRDTGPGGYHPGNVGGRHRPGPPPLRRPLHQVLDTIPELRCLFEPPLPDRLVKLLLQGLSRRRALRLAGLLHLRPGRPLVQQIDGLVG